MRRISSQYAQAGMVLCRDIYDNYGNILIYQGTRLTLENIDVLGRLGGGEIFIRDHRVDDVPVSSMIPGRIEGENIRQLRDLMDHASDALRNQSSTKLATDRLETAVFSMVEQLFPVTMGEVNASGCYANRDYDFAHPIQTAELALAIARQLGASEAELHQLGIAAVLQNIGYLALPNGILEEPATLTKIETHEMQQHAQYGFQILQDYTNLDSDTLQTVFQHHERWDGSGYPRGLQGDSISRDARILALADTYYALVSRRPHRSANKPHEALEFIMAYNGELFDPKLVSVFIKLIQTYPTGVMVNLNTGEAGIIIGAHPGMSSRPIIRICYDKNHNEWAKPFDLDLSDPQQQHRLVTEVVEY